MTDSPRIYISCMEEDLEEVLDLSHALEKKGLKSSIGVFDGEVAYLKNEGLPGESLDAINCAKSRLNYQILLYGSAGIKNAKKPPRKTGNPLIGGEASI
jgi:hypothetical protein